MKNIFKLSYFLFSLFTAAVGMGIHGCQFWAVVDFIFAPLAWLKWIICKEVTWTIIKHSFDFLFQ